MSTQTSYTSPLQRWILDSQRELLRRLETSQPPDIPARGDPAFLVEK
jgi:hypothetical protein